MSRNAGPLNHGTASGGRGEIDGGHAPRRRARARSGNGRRGPRGAGPFRSLRRHRREPAGRDLNLPLWRLRPGNDHQEPTIRPDYHVEELGPGSRPRVRRTRYRRGPARRCSSRRGTRSRSAVRERARRPLPPDRPSPSRPRQAPAQGDTIGRSRRESGQAGNVAHRRSGRGAFRRSTGSIMARSRGGTQSSYRPIDRRTRPPPSTKESSDRAVVSRFPLVAPAADGSARPGWARFLFYKELVATRLSSWIAGNIGPLWNPTRCVGAKGSSNAPPRGRRRYALGGGP